MLTIGLAIIFFSGVILIFRLFLKSQKIVQKRKESKINKDFNEVQNLENQIVRIFLQQVLIMACTATLTVLYSLLF